MLAVQRDRDADAGINVDRPAVYYWQVASHWSGCVERHHRVRAAGPIDDLPIAMIGRKIIQLVSSKIEFDIIMTYQIATDEAVERLVWTAGARSDHEIDIVSYHPAELQALELNIALGDAAITTQQSKVAAGIQKMEPHSI